MIHNQESNVAIISRQVSNASNFAKPYQREVVGNPSDKVPSVDSCCMPHPVTCYVSSSLSSSSSF
jgi:hypothetical protein